MKYIAEIEHYANCPTCEGGSPSNLQFFDSIKEMLTYALDNLNDYGINNVYRVNFKSKSAKILTEYGPMDLSYDYGRHKLTGIKFKYKTLKLRTIDDGKGNKIWVRE